MHFFVYIILIESKGPFHVNRSFFVWIMDSGRVDGLNVVLIAPNGMVENEKTYRMKREMSEWKSKS